MCQCVVSICRKVLPGATNITNTIIAGTEYCIYLSCYGQISIKMHAQVFHGACYLDSVLADLKSCDLVTVACIPAKVSIGVRSSTYDSDHKQITG